MFETASGQAVLRQAALFVTGRDAVSPLQPAELHKRISEQSYMHFE